MATLLRKFLPSSSPKIRDDGDDSNVDYSFALEYSGPPVSHDIPLVVPIDINRIPTASVVVTASMLSNLPLPVVQPFPKSKLLSKNLSKELKPGSKADISTNLASHSGEAVELSGELGFIDVEEVTPKVSDEIDSSGTLGFSDSRDDSPELSGSSEVEEDLRALSPEIHSIAGEDDRTSVVTAGDPESSDAVHELTAHYDPEIFRRRTATVKKGLCNRCNKRNRFTEKVVCIVCAARYCSNCVVRAMGSMPEGRKCITCIGFPIDESKRRSLGKSTRILRQLLSDSEVKGIVRSEISCEANQLPSRLLYVNDKPLCPEELFALQMCRNPPKKLKPGRYWYDKVSGFWGKEGEKPCQIISAQLAVGNCITLKASNGDTNVRINGREITKAELRMLQWVRIQCEGAPHFWVSKDGSYQEEGQNNVIGKIWDKVGIKLVCALLSLPTPPEDPNPSGEEVTNTANRVLPNFLQQKTLNKLLLVGCDKSGTSTIFKQAKMVYNVPFSEDERRCIKLQIQSSLYDYLAILLEGRERFEDEWLTEMKRKRSDEPGPSSSCDRVNEENIYNINQRLKAFSDWLLEVVVSGNMDNIFPASSREYAPLIEDIRKDKAFQATYERRDELQMLPRIASYFLDRAVEISSADYDPSDTDILYAEGITPSNGLASMEFSLPKSTQDSFMDHADQNDLLHRYQLIRLHSSSLGQNCKWLGMFEDTDLVLYCVSLTDYDQVSDNTNRVSSNKMLESKKLFESIVTHPTFRQKNFHLILNKFDLLEEKIKQIPLTRCEWFHDFNPVISHNQGSTSSSNTNPSLAQRAFHYIAKKFKTLFSSITGGRKLYVSRVTGSEQDCIDEALRYTREILKWEEEKPRTLHELSSCSVDASSSS